jgi:SAM-dependent methyltransferase
LILEKIAFEDFPKKIFDFILCSHVLQYIDTPEIPFVKKILESLAPGGEAWIVLQEEIGINSLIETSIPYLNNPSPYFEKWFVHDHIRNVLVDFRIEIRTKKIPSFFRTPNLRQPGKEENDMMNCILINCFEPANRDLIAALSKTIRKISRNGYIYHEVGITKVRRIT